MIVVLGAEDGCVQETQFFQLPHQRIDKGAEFFHITS